MNMAEAFAEIERHPLPLTYMQVALMHLREWGTGPDTREDVREFLQSTQHLSGDAIAVLTPDKVSLLVNDAGQLLSFA
jgi:hypothetical protein